MVSNAKVDNAAGRYRHAEIGEGARQSLRSRRKLLSAHGWCKMNELFRIARLHDLGKGHCPGRCIWRARRLALHKRYVRLLCGLPYHSEHDVLLENAVLPERRAARLEDVNVFEACGAE